MDPDAALAELREFVYKMLETEEDDLDLNRLAELFRGLDEWLEEGGFLPSDWASADRR